MLATCSEDESMDGFSVAVANHFAQLQVRLLSEHAFYVGLHKRRWRQSLSALAQQNVELMQLVSNRAADASPAKLPVSSLDWCVSKKDVSLDAKEENKEVESPCAVWAEVVAGQTGLVADIGVSESTAHLRLLPEQIKRVSAQMGVESSMNMAGPISARSLRYDEIRIPDLRDDASSPVADEASVLLGNRSLSNPTMKNIVPEGALSPSSERPLCRPLKKRTTRQFTLNHSHSDSQPDQNEDQNEVEEYSLRESWLEIPIQSVPSISGNEKDNAMITHDEEWEEIEDGAVSPCILHPSSRKRLIWDISSIVLVSYDLVMVPISFAFQLTESFLQKILTAMIVVFWTFDIVMSTCTGFYTKDGKIVMARPTILRSYAKSWFPLDVAMVSLDWTIVALDSLGLEKHSNMNSGRLLRGMRILRIVRLLRLTKLQKVARMIQDRIDSEYVSILVNVVKQLVCILATCHFVACAWFRIGFDDSTGSASDGDESWVTAHKMQDATMAYKYCTALHWSLTQFTPASMDVNPRNLRERLFAVFVLLYAMVIFSSFVSSITNAMTNLRNMGAKQSNQFWLLRKYFRQHHISNDLSQRVFRYVSMTLMTQQTRVQKKDIELISMLSKPLQIGLQAELYEPELKVHPFFESLAERSRAIIRKLCCTALKQVALSRADVLFTAGEAAREMYFLSRGVMVYAEQKAGTSTLLKKGQWCCEAVLWVDWVHRGTMCARVESELLALNAQQFQDVMMEHPTHLSYPCRHGQNFVDALNGTLRDSQSGVSDVPVVNCE